MIIGIDLDNTLARYDDVFYAEALRRKLIPAETPATKEAVRDAMRRAGRENDWTELQGWAYGPGMAKATAFEGAADFIAAARAAGITIFIISHRTRKPLRGAAHDLHAAAKKWLRANDITSDIFLEEDKPAKLARIASQACTHFIDDLPEFLAEAAFPKKVLRYHFDPSDSPSGGQFPRLKSWLDAADVLLPDSKLRAVADKLCAAAKLSGDFTIERVSGTANNRLYRLRGKTDAALKIYWRAPNDSRDRFGHETRFLKFAAAAGCAQPPRLLAEDAEAGATLLEWIDGQKLTPAEVKPEHVREAENFFAALNAKRPRPDSLPNASEACFSLQAHVELVSARVAALNKIPREGLGAAAANFAANALAQACEKAAAPLRGRKDYAVELAIDKRAASPSDFGFHNALLSKNKLRFLDFEYAGWDDPAKTVCDFFLQPAIPAPASERAAFVSAIASAVEDVSLINRANALAPLYRVKWACILLNEFLPDSGRRRAFALGKEAAAARRAQRLEAAKQLLGAA